MLNKNDILYKFLLLLHLLFENDENDFDLNSCLYCCKKFIDNSKKPIDNETESNDSKSNHTKTESNSDSDDGNENENEELLLLFDLFKKKIIKIFFT